MKRLSRNADCPCGSGRKAKGCCARVLDGELAGTPEALMRSRYTAYTVGDYAHLMRTTHRDSPHLVPDRAQWIERLREFSEETTFQALHVEHCSENGDEGVVHFRATLERQGADISFCERSRFRKLGGRWYYLDGEG